MGFLRNVALPLALLLAGSRAMAQEIDLDEIVRKPTIGNYKGYAEFKMGRYDSAHRIWQALDDKGFGEAAFNLGILYEDGLGRPRDMARAMAFYRRGAANGSVKAQFRIGTIYWHGAPGIAVDREEGRRFLALAAANGDSEAARYLQQGEATGALAEADRAIAAGRPEEAVRLLAAAAASGDPRAQTRLGWSYEAGRGVDRDLTRAADWFAEAAGGGDGEAMYALAVMHATGAGREKDEAAAKAWLERSADAGYLPAMVELGRR